MNEKVGKVLYGRTLGVVLCGLLAIGLAMITSCSSERPKPMQQPTPEQVKGNADRTFDKLKQEERERKPVGQ
ncbi:MAG: hypothetical protein ACREIM_02890 [Nitrospiraceae bacterium]